MPFFSVDAGVIIVILSAVFTGGSVLGSNRYIHKCQERRLKRIERKLGIEEE